MLPTHTDHQVPLHFPKEDKLRPGNCVWPEEQERSINKRGSCEVGELSISDLIIQLLPSTCFNWTIWILGVLCGWNFKWASNDFYNILIGLPINYCIWIQDVLFFRKQNVMETFPCMCLIQIQSWFEKKKQNQKLLH